MRKHKISAFIPVQNVEEIIQSCLDSIQWVDEIFIVDSFSTDKTVEICKRDPKVKLVQHEYENSGAQRFWGMPQVKHEWVLIIDSDERCNPELQKEIESVLSMDEIPFDGYQVHIKTKFLGKVQNHDRYLGFRGMRLVRREHYVDYELNSVHSKLRIKNHSLIVNNKAFLIHEPIREFGSHINKMARYAQWAAKDMFDKGKRTNPVHLVFRPFYKFFNHYFFKLGFLDGIHGLILCSLAGMSIFLKYYALMHLQYNTSKTKAGKTAN